MKYAITAATGHFGQLAYHYLQALVDNQDIVVIARNQAKATEQFPEAEVRVADYDDVDALTRAFAGIDRVLFISSQPGGTCPVTSNIKMSLMPWLQRMCHLSLTQVSFKQTNL